MTSGITRLLSLKDKYTVKEISMYTNQDTNVETIEELPEVNERIIELPDIN